MKVATQISALRTRRKPIVLAAGFFDGLHRGHRRVIDLTIARARTIGGEAWVLTFDTHPLKVLDPERAPRLLTSTPHKLELLAELDPDGCIVMPFTRALAALSPDGFVRLLRANAPGLREVFVGDNWRFGRGKAGTPARLMDWGLKLGFTVNEVSPVTRGGRHVSSSRIRSHIMAGELKDAEELLGRPFSVLGTVRRGASLGRKLGFPTANLDPHNEALPPRGVYAVRARLRSGARHAAWLKGVVNLGVRPTLHAGRRLPAVLELHLPGVRRNLYGQDIEVVFVKKIRDERKFSSMEKLRRRIALDIRESRRILADAVEPGD